MLPKAVKSCPKSNKSPNLVTLLKEIVFYGRTANEQKLDMNRETRLGHFKSPIYLLLGDSLTLVATNFWPKLPNFVAIFEKQKCEEKLGDF